MRNFNESHFGFNKLLYLTAEMEQANMRNEQILLPGAQSNAQKILELFLWSFFHLSKKKSFMSTEGDIEI